MCRYYYDHDKDGNEEICLATCRHLVGDCNSYPNGKTIKQDGDKVGNVQDFEHDLDTIIVDSSGKNTSITGGIEEQYTTRTISGHVSKWGTIDLEQTGDPIYKMGVKTGKEAGEILEAKFEPDGCPDFNGQGIRADIDVCSGDSGGPLYEVKNGDAYMLSHAAMSASQSNRTECNIAVWRHTWGPSAYSMINHHGGGFVRGI